MKGLFRLIVVLVLFGVSTFVVSRTAHAQAALAVTSNSEYATLRQNYRQQLDAYRTADKQYQIAIEQYRQLKTLTALEEAVQQTHQAMKLRNDVLISYLELLQYQLQTATGVNLDQKTKMLAALSSDIANLKSFRLQIETEPDRTLINQRAADFAVLAKPLENHAYRVQTMLAVGKLQTVYDKALALRTEIDATVLDKQDIQKAQRERASQEIKNNLTQAKLIIDDLNSETADDDSEFSQSSFSSLQTDLTQIYAGLSQSLSYLLELLSI